MKRIDRAPAAGKLFGVVRGWWLLAAIIAGCAGSPAAGSPSAILPASPGAASSAAVATASPAATLADGLQTVAR